MTGILKNQIMHIKSYNLISALKFFIRKFILARIIFYLNLVIKPKNLNIGSGKRAWIGWNLLDEIHDLNIDYVKFSENTNLNFESNSQILVYTSHFLEHVNYYTALRVLQEAKRVLHPKGYLVVKIPNYDSVLKSYFNGDHQYIEKFGFGNLPKSWPKYMVEDDVESKVSMIFAGYYTHNYGDHFLKPEEANIELGYHGPAKLPKSEVLKILTLKDPHKISEKLVNLIKKDSEFYQFNHQQAWSNEQFKNFLKELGFQLIYITSELENYLSKKIPDYYSMSKISSYFLVKK